MNRVLLIILVDYSAIHTAIRTRLTSTHVANLICISARYRSAVNKCLRGRKCDEMIPKAEERLKEATSKSLGVTPKHQRELAEMIKSRLGAEEQKPEQPNDKKRGRNERSEGSKLASKDAGRVSGLRSEEHGEQSVLAGGEGGD